MTPKRHAKLAHDLIEACDGLDEAAKSCRLHKSRLSEFQNWRSGSFMPADVMHDLEAYCGEPIYSREIAACRPHAPVVADALSETHDVVQAAAAMLPLAAALARGDASAVDAFMEAAERLIKEATEVRACGAANVEPLRRVS